MRCSERLRVSRRVLSASGAASTFGASAVRATVGHAPRHAPPSLSLGSLGAFAHLSRAMSASEDIPSPMPPTKLHALKTSSSRVCLKSGSLDFRSFESFEQPTFSEFCIRESLASSTASLLGVHREFHTPDAPCAAARQGGGFGLFSTSCAPRVPTFQRFTFERPSRVPALFPELFHDVYPESNGT